MKQISASILTFTSTNIIVRAKQNTMRKLQSTNNANRQVIIAACPISYTLSIIEGRWKPMILHQLFSGVSRYGELRKAIPPITERMLTAELKELELRGLITREEQLYALTERGESLREVFSHLGRWGKTDQSKKQASTLSTKVLE